MDKAFIIWKDSYSLGIEEIDAQHKKLVEIINRFYNAFYNNKHKRVISGILSQLVEYAKYHFTTEEQYFERLNYPDANYHITEHKRFIIEINRLIKANKSNPGATAFKLITFLQQWLTGHILISDKRYAGYIRDNL